MSLPNIGNSFMYIDTSPNDHGENVYCSFERTDIIHINIITFCYNCFSTGSNKAMGRFKILFLLADNKWSMRYNIPIMIDI